MGSFTGVSLFAPDGQYLFLGGTLLSGLSTLFWLGIINLFFQSQLLFQVYIWGGLLIFCGFIGHSLDLFIDFMQVFRKVLILLMQKNDSNNKKRRQDWIFIPGKVIISTNS